MATRRTQLPALRRALVSIALAAFVLIASAAGAVTAAQDASGRRAALPVQGAVTVHIELDCIDVDIASSGNNEVRAELRNLPGEVRLAQHGNRVDVQLSAATLAVCRSHWHDMRWQRRYLVLEVPRASGLELASSSGDMRVEDVYGPIGVRASSGDLRARHATTVEAVLSSGDVTLDDVAGEVRLRTVSGDARVRQTSGPASKLEFGTSSGDLEWIGACGAGCRLETRSSSGDVRLQLQPSSSFAIQFVTGSGDFSDGLRTEVLRPLDDDNGGELRARYGRGEGVIECQTSSGDLQLRR